jgi:PAS domain-containing protein
MSTISDASAPDLAGDIRRNPLIDALLEQLPVGIVVAARDGQFEYVNPISQRLFDEQQRVHTTSKPWLGIAEVPASELGPIHWIIARSLLIGEIIRDEEVEYLDAHNEEWRTLNVSATPIRDASGEIDRVVVSFIDVTLRNRARDWEPVMRTLSRL